MLFSNLPLRRVPVQRQKEILFCLTQRFEDKDLDQRTLLRNNKERSKVKTEIVWEYVKIARERD